VRVVNPATGDTLAELPEDRPQDVAAKAVRARAAQPAWAARPLDERLEIIRRFRERLVADREELALLLTSEVGKPITQARNEVKGVLGRLDYFLARTEDVLQEQIVWSEDALEERISQEPLGVVANISAWNYPWFVGSNVFIPALLTGNAVLYKPSELASLTGLAIAERLLDAGVPEDVFVPVIGGGPTGAALVAQPVDGLFFTGSFATGQRIAESLAGRLLRLQMELGGKDPAYVCDDVDVEAAAEALADGAFYNSGQSCCAVERIYVHESVHDAFVDRLLLSVQAFVVGDPLRDDTYIGPVTRAAQLGVLEAQVADARAQGGSVLLGGERMAGRGNYFAPTVITQTTHAMAVMREESFGPLIGIQRVQSDDEAKHLMNDTEYGLTAAVYARDRERARSVLAGVNTGSAYWNCCDRVSPRLPWSGRGHSGLGSTLGVAGIQAFVQPKAWHLVEPGGR
jgi:acyl-CoA reductase-like NAD-dependent aldehyde dehydrogenase